MHIPKAAVINDLSGLGKCSLTAAIPILSVMGVQACPLPTGVLSNQTGFSSYACINLTNEMDRFIAEWKKRKISFDGIYTGFLCDTLQAEKTARFIAEFSSPQTLVLIDPVLGDNGCQYPALPLEMKEAIQVFLPYATIITPNYTEACLLTGSPYREPNLEQAWEMACQLSEKGPGIVVITGIRQNNQVYNAVYTADHKEKFFISNQWVGTQGYSGTGDILASVLCGGLLKGMDVRQALALACNFLEVSIREAVTDGTDPNEGIAFENHMSLLMRKEP